MYRPRFTPMTIQLWRISVTLICWLPHRFAHTWFVLHSNAYAQAEPHVFPSCFSLAQANRRSLLNGVLCVGVMMHNFFFDPRYDKKAVIVNIGISSNRCALKKIKLQKKKKKNPQQERSGLLLLFNCPSMERSGKGFVYYTSKEFHIHNLSFFITNTC